MVNGTFKPFSSCDGCSKSSPVAPRLNQRRARITKAPHTLRGRWKVRRQTVTSFRGTPGHLHSVGEQDLVSGADFSLDPAEGPLSRFSQSRGKQLHCKPGLLGGSAPIPLFQAEARQAAAKKNPLLSSGRGDSIKVNRLGRRAFLLAQARQPQIGAAVAWIGKTCALPGSSDRGVQGLAACQGQFKRPLISRDGVLAAILLHQNVTQRPMGI